MDIVISGLTKSFGENKVLKGFNGIIPGNKVTFLMGPSGCGKTTLINLLMGLINSDSGEISGVPYHKSAVFQEDRLCEAFNAVSNVRLVCDNKTSNANIVEHLERIGLKGNLSKPVSEFSGGMKRRVAIVRAILAKSEILFLDEPFKGLDTETKKTAINYLKDNTKGKTVIIVTHDIEEVKAFDGNLISM